MLARRYRLSRRDFETLRLYGKRTHGDHCTLLHRPSNEAKCAVVVSKKTARTATLRNYLRRRTYDALTHILFVGESRHIAVFLKPSAAQLSYADLCAELQRTCARAGL